jgi:hypothetical protein
VRSTRRQHECRGRKQGSNGQGSLPRYSACYSVPVTPVINGTVIMPMALLPEA